MGVLGREESGGSVCDPDWPLGYGAGMPDDVDRNARLTDQDSGRI